MGFIQFTDIGDFQISKSFLRSLKTHNEKIFETLDSYGREGVNALANGTPVESGIAAESWGYTISFSKSEITIVWFNKDIENGFPVAVMLQYGHATGTGGYVQGRDYINPIMKPVFDDISDAAWRLYTSG